MLLDGQKWFPDNVNAFQWDLKVQSLIWHSKSVVTMTAFHKLRTKALKPKLIWNLNTTLLLPCKHQKWIHTLLFKSLGSVRIFNVFESLLCSPRLHLFNKKSKMWNILFNIIWYDMILYNLKYNFYICSNILKCNFFQWWQSYIFGSYYSSLQFHMIL